MALSEPIKCFPTKKEAHKAFILLEAQNIACDAKKANGDWCYTLYVSPEHTEEAGYVIDHLGFSRQATKPAEELKKQPATSNHHLGTIRRAMKTEERSLGKKLTTLVISLLIFAGLGLLRGSPINLLLILLILLIHESGHWLGMKLFKYKDVQMFFIPGFGAAVSGTEATPNAKQKAIVSLMGPIPGIIIGIGCLIAFFITQIEILGLAADLFIMINAFNLLPFTPLDGGRFLEAVLFTRHPRAEIVFKALAIAGIAGIAWLWKSVALGILAYFTLVSIKHAWTMSSTSASLRKELPEDHAYTSDDIPDHFLEKIVSRVSPLAPTQQNEIKQLAQSAKAIWSKMIIRHCSIRASVGLTLLYLFFATPSLGLLALSQVMATQQPEPVEQPVEEAAESNPYAPASYEIYPAPEQ